MDAIEQVSRDDISEAYLVELCIGRCSDELTVVYRKILKTFFEANYFAHIDELEQLYATVSDQNIDTTEVVPYIDTILRTAGDRALGMLQVTLDEDTPIDVYAEILDVLLGFDPTTTPSILMAAIENTEDSVEALCALLENLGTYEADAIHQYVSYVGGDFVPNLKNILQQALDNSEEDILPINDALQQRRIARLVAQKGETKGAELGRIGNGVGASMESLYTLYVGDMIDSSMESAIDNLYSLASLSCESFEAAQKAVGVCLDDLYFEADNRRKAEQIRLKYAGDYRTIYGEQNG